MPVPEQLDYDFWLGPAPYKPYNPERVHAKFRGYWDYDGGGLKTGFSVQVSGVRELRSKSQDIW